MAPDPRITRVAEILIDKHGRRAATVAQERAKDRIDKRDYTTALVWVQVLEAASDPSMMATGASLAPPVPMMGTVPGRTRRPNAATACAVPSCSLAWP